MNTRVVLTFTAALLLLAVSLPVSAQDSRACNNQLIRGTYGFTLEGQKLGGKGPVGPQVGVALTTFDGKGSLTQIDSVTVNGVPVANLNETPTPGTYTVNSNCTGSFVLNFTDGRPTVTTDFVVVQNGNEIDTVVVAPSNCGTAGGPPQGCLATRSIGKRRLSFDW